MQNCKHCLIVCFTLLFCTNSFVQAQPNDITGLWTGLMFNDTTELNYRYEIAISEKNGRLTGFSHTFFLLDGKEYYGVKKIKISIDGDKIITQDLKLLRNNYPVKPPKNVYVVNVLNFERKQHAYVLSGMFETNRTREYAPATGFIHLEKKIDLKQSSLVLQLKEMGLQNELSFLSAEALVTETDVNTKPAEIPVVTKQPVVKANQPIKEIQQEKVKAVQENEGTKTETVAIAKPVTESQPEIVQIKKVTIPTATTKQPASDIKGRIIETIQSVDYTADSLIISLYDNGEVDGDTVSVIMNGNVIMPMVGLGSKPVRKIIYTKDIPDSIQIVMYAENLGALPPNTGLLIVNDGQQRFEIRFSGDLKKNAAIVFRRKKN